MSAARLTFALVVWAGILQAQSAQISGVIRDPSNLSIKGAQVGILNEQTGGRRNALSNESGSYSLPSLTPGTYRVTVRASGFETTVQEGFKLEVGENAQLDFSMRLGDARSVVTVRGDAPSMNTENAAVGTVIDRDTIDQMPLNGRGIQSLIELSPGVVPTPVWTLGVGQFAANGQRPNSNYFTLDGVSVNFGVWDILSGSNILPGSQIGNGLTPANNLLGTFSNLVSPEALQEFRIQTSTFTPELGRLPGAQIELLSRSGTNRYTGSLFEFFRNDKTEANDWFANEQALPRMPLRFNNFGGAVGGPLLLPGLYNGHNRTFFFFSAESLVLRQDPGSAAFPVPTAEARSSAPPLVAELLNAYPFPNRPPASSDPPGFAEYVSNSGLSKVTQQTYGLRLDQMFSTRLMAFARYNRAPAQRLITPLDAPEIGNYQILTETLTFGLTHTLTPNMVNEVRLNGSRQLSSSQTGVNPAGNAQPPPDSILFPPGYSPGNSQTAFQISPAPYILIGSSPGHRARQLQGIDNFSYIFGAHQVKAGADYRWYSPVQTYPRFQSQFSFSGLDGPAGAYSAIIPENAVYYITAPDTAFVFSAFSAYAQDTWRVSHQLTLTYGFRWEVVPGPHVSAGEAVAGSGSQSGDTPVTLLQPGRASYATTWTNLAPRLGLAWQLHDGAANKSVLRVGAGQFFDLGQNSVEGRFIVGPAVDFYLNQPLGSFNGGTPLIQLAPSPPSLTQGSVRIIPPNYQLPYTWEWNATFEQSIGQQGFSAGYVGALGRRLPAWVEQQQVSSTFVYTSNNSNSSYHALQLQFNRRMSARLHMLVSYTWAHSLDDLSTDQLYSFPNGGPTSGYYDPREKGSSDFDVRHVLSGSIIAVLPSPKVKVFAALFRDWSANSIFSARTAVPTDLLADNFVHRPDLVSGQPLYLYGSQYPGGKAFNLAAFSAPPPGRDGDLGRNILRGLGAWQIDFALHRDFKVAGKFTLQFRAEAFNVLNHPNFANPSDYQSPGILTLSSTSSGAATQMLSNGLSPYSALGGLNSLFQTGGTRTMQFALRLVF